MSEKVVLSSSAKDRHGINLTKQMLEKGVVSINGKEKMRYLVNHRREYPIVGYMDNAELVEENGVYLLVAERIFYIKKEEVEWDRELIAEKPEHSVHIQRRAPATEDFVITLDPNNFESSQQYFEVEQTLMDELHDDFKIITDTRKNLIPEPRIIVSLLTVGPLWILTKPLIKKIGERIADDIGEAIYDAGKKQMLSLVQKVRKLMTITIQHAIPKDKPLSLIFELHGEPYIELHAKTNDAELVAKGLSIYQLSKMRKRVNELREKVSVAEAHFDLSEKGKWVFTYLITTTGVQIGKKTVFKKRDKLFERIKLGPQFGHSIGADITYEYRTMSSAEDSSQEERQ